MTLPALPPLNDTTNWYAHYTAVDAAVRERVKLRRWFAQLANRNAAPAQIVVWGDSISEGAGATALRRRWMNNLQRNLNARYGMASGAEWPYIPGWYATPTAGQPVSLAGTVTQDGNYGLGQRLSIIDVGGSLTYTFTGTRAKLVYVSGSITGIIRVVVDGGTPVLVDTYHATIVSLGNVYDLGALTAGSHTVVISMDATTPAGRTIYFEGLQTFNGDETSGIRVIDAAHYGTNSYNFAGANATNQATSLVAAGTVGLAIVVYGTNDAASPIAVATMKANLADGVSRLRATGFAGSVLYLAVYKAGPTSDATWDPYVTALQELAAADADAEFLDLGPRIVEPQPTEPNAASLGLYADAVHPSDAGHGWIADVVAGFIAHR